MRRIHPNDKRTRHWDEPGKPRQSKKAKRRQEGFERQARVHESRFKAKGRDLPEWCECGRPWRYGSRVRQVVNAVPTANQLEYLEMNSGEEMVLAEALEVCHYCGRRIQVKRVAHGPRRISLMIRTLEESEPTNECPKCGAELPIGARGPYKQKDGKSFWLKPKGFKGRVHTC